MNCIVKFVLFTLCILSTVQVLAQRSPHITTNELREHVKYLSSDKLEGRLTGAAGANIAADYIANEFKHYGLKSIGDSNTYFQSFDFISGVKLGSNNNFTYTFKQGELQSSISSDYNALVPILDTDYRPFGFSASDNFIGNIVFVGYGISAIDKNYDDYKDINVQGKAVLAFRYAPPADSSHGNFDQFASLRYKASKAKELGAKAILIVTGPIDSENDKLVSLAYDQAMGNAGLIAISITQACADSLLKTSQTNVKQLQDRILQTKLTQSFEITGCTISLNVDVQEIHARAKNVVGYIPGNDPILKNEIVVIGAHYDHIGYGGEGSGSLKPDTNAIHPGADDNASGTAGLLELSQLFSYQQHKLKRSMLFISFTGEELGLLGSGYYIKHPLVSLESTVTMLNMDMIGHLRNNALIVFGTGTSPIFDSLVTYHNTDSTFVLKLNKDGFGPSDHSSFYGKKIPVLHFFTDLNEYYHRPYDTWDKLNYKGYHKIVEYISSIAFDINQLHQKPKYISMEMPRSPGNAGRNTRVFVGTIPDFGEQVEGMKISGVREGSPGAKAGLQAGDIIIKFGKVDVKNLYDYSYALGEYKAGDIVDVVIKRGKETLSLKITLERRN